jgi:hypothetical protein
VGGTFAHHDAVSDRVVRGLVCSNVGPPLLLLNHCLKIGRLRACSSPVTLLFADEALGWPPGSLVSMGVMSLRWSVLVAAILLLVKKRLVQILEAPLAGFMHIRRESFEKRLEVPSTSRLIVGLKTLGLLVVGPQHCLEAQDFVGVSQDGPSRFGGSGSNTPRCYLNRECR